MDWTQSKNGSGKELRKYLRVNWRKVEGEDRLRWLEDVEKNLQYMKVQRWWQKAVDREEWASVIMEAKALKGPYSRVSTIHKKCECISWKLMFSKTDVHYTFQ